jgi:hypothetical protein
VLAAGPLLVVQLRAYARGDVQPALSFDEVKFYSPAMASFVTPSRVQPVYGRWFAFAGEYGDPGTTGMRSETTLGLTFCLLALVGFWRMRRDGTLFWGSAAVLFLVLTLGPYLRLTGTVTTTIPLPYLALYELAPPLRAARDPTRALPMAVLMLTVVAAFGLRAWLARMRTKRSALALTMAISGAMVFESVTGWPAKTPAAELIPPPYRRLSGAGTAGAVMDLTGDHQAMLAQTFHGLPITAGALAVPRAAASRKMLNAEVDLRDPTQLFALDPATRARYISADREMIGRLGIRFVVAPPATASIGLLAEALGLRPIEKGAVEVYIATARGGTPDGQ